MMFPLVLDYAADGVPVAVTCRVLNFSEQAFYKWKSNPVSVRDGGKHISSTLRLTSTPMTRHSATGSSPTNSTPAIKRWPANAGSGGSARLMASFRSSTTANGSEVVRLVRRSTMTCSSGTSAPLHRIGSGSRTSPSTPLRRASSTWRDQGPVFKPDRWLLVAWSLPIQRGRGVIPPAPRRTISGTTTASASDDPNHAHLRRACLVLGVPIREKRSDEPVLFRGIYLF